MEYYRLIIGATSKEEARSILKLLIDKRFVVGGKYNKSTSIHRWKDNIDEEEYYNVSAYTIKSKRDEIIEEVVKVHQDEVPAIYFHKIDYGSKPFLDWISDNIK